MHPGLVLPSLAARSHRMGRGVGLGATGAGEGLGFRFRNGWF